MKIFASAVCTFCLLAAFLYFHDNQTNKVLECLTLGLLQIPTICGGWDEN